MPNREPLPSSVLDFLDSSTRRGFEEQIAADEGEVEGLLEAYTIAKDEHRAAIVARKQAPRGSRAAPEAAERSAGWSVNRLLGKLYAREKRIKANRVELAKLD